MHPIERLRYVARSSGVDHGLLARETAGAFTAFSRDPAGLVTACRRIVARQPSSGPIWWLAARVLTAPDPLAEVREAVSALEEDLTGRELLYSIDDDVTVCVLGWPEPIGQVLVRRGDLRTLVVDIHGEGAGLTKRLAHNECDTELVTPTGLGAAVTHSQLVLLEASAVGPTEYLGIAGSRAAASTASVADVPVWLVTGVGRLLPQAMWNGVVSYREGARAPWDEDDEIVPLSLIDRVVGPYGVATVKDALSHVDTPIAPELLKRL